MRVDADCGVRVAHASDHAGIAVIFAFPVRAELPRRAWRWRIAACGWRILFAGFAGQVISRSARQRYAGHVRAGAKRPALNDIFALEIMFAAIVDAVRFALILIEVLPCVAFGAGHTFAVFDFIDAFAFRDHAFGLEAFVFAAYAAGTFGIALAFLMAVDQLASAGNPSRAFGADVAVAAAVVQVIGFALTVIVVHADVAADPCLAFAIEEVVSFGAVAGCCGAQAVAAFPVNPAADHILANVAVAAAVIDVVFFADAFV